MSVRGESLSADYYYGCSTLPITRSCSQLLIACTALMMATGIFHTEANIHLWNIAAKPSPSISENKTQEKCNLGLSLESPDNFQDWK